ncbi:hypothetical protein H9Q70_002186 [Fusarium xylarioides]|nr:hypothetical protein H9Q70_002186 [Fusarium xylarioides]KAG5785371.1 hypothetical protein H9Q73_000952 [Fusarium xylarioides]
MLKIQLKTEALKALYEQWTLEISEIKSPERQYREKRQVLLSNYSNELSQLRQHSPDPDEYARRSETILEHAGDLRELEIQYQSSVTLLERQFAERLEAANKRLACHLFQTLGDTLWDHSVSTVLNQCLKQCLRPKEPTVEADRAEALLEARNDQDTDPDITLEEPIYLKGDQSQGSRPIADNSGRQDRALAQASALTEARVSVPRETLNQHQSEVHQTPPFQERESASHSYLVTNGQCASSPPAVQAPTPSPSRESSRSSDNVIDSQARPGSIAMPASETNLGQNGGRARLDMWPSSQIPNQSASSTKGAEALNNNPGEQWTDSLVAHLCAPLKRLQAEASNRKQKRQKLPIEPPNIPRERIIAFEQVFQDGNAQTKYIIVQHPPEFGHWYILECKEHNKHFYEDPIRGASRHLIGQEHGLKGDHSLAVKMLGTRVLYCNEKLPAKNNRITMQSFPQVAGPTNVIPENRTKGDPPCDVDIIPVVGKIYATKFPKLSHAYPILVLPWTAFDHFPHMKQLLRDTPPCFLFDEAVDRYPRGWTKDYEDGGSRFKDRAYPVVYFHKEKFPEHCNVGWVPITNFKVYDPEHTEVACSKLVDRYLQNKDPRLAPKYHHSTDASIVILDDDDGEDAQMQVEDRNVNPRAFDPSASKRDGTDVPRPQIDTQESNTVPGPMARIEYPFVSGGSGDMRNTESRTSLAVTSISKQPVVNVVELGEVHAESAFNRPAPRNEDTYSRVSLRPS